MASRREQLEVGIVATDGASKVIDPVADKVDRLDGTQAAVALSAEDDASSEVDALIKKISGLTDEDQKVILSAEARKLESEVRRATILLGQVDGETYEAVLDARNDAKAKYDAVEAALDDIERRTAEATLEADDKATGDISRVDGQLDELDRRTADATLEADDKATGDIRRVDSKLDEFDRRTADATIDVDRGAGFDSVTGALSAMPGQIGTAGTELSKLSTRGGAAAAFVGLMLSAAGYAQDTALTIDDIATFTGASHEEASRLWAVWSDNKLEVGDLLDIVAQMTGVLADSPEIAEQLGLKLDGSRSPLQLLIDAVDALNSDQLTANERILLGSQLFGEEGVRQINGIIAALGDGGLSGAIDNVDPGRLYSAEDAEKARALTGEWREFTGQLKEFASTIGPPALEVLTRLADGANTLADGIGTVFGGIGDAFDFIRNYDIGRMPWDQGDDDPPFWADPEVMDQIIADAREHAAAEGDVADATITAAEAFEAWQKSSRTLEDFPATVANIAKHMREGTTDSDSFAQSLAVLQAAFPDMTPADIFSAIAQKIDEAKQKTGDYKTENYDLEGALRDAEQAALDAAEAHRDGLTAALEAQADALQENIDLLDEQNDALRSSVDAQYALEDATADLEETREEARKKGGDDAEVTGEAAEAVQEYRDAVIDAVDAQITLNEEQAKANGVTRSRVQAIDEENDAYLAEASTVEGAMRQAILAHVLRLNGIPEERITEILAGTDEEDLAAAEAELDGLANKRRVAAFQADASEASIVVVEAQLQAVTKTRGVPIVGVPDMSKVYGALANLKYAATVPVTFTGFNKGRATGDPYTSAGTFLVGEQGPEIVTLPAGSQIDPNRADTGRAPVVHRTTNNFHINVPPGGSAVAELRRHTRIQGPPVGPEIAYS